MADVLLHNSGLLVDERPDLLCRPDAGYQRCRMMRGNTKFVDNAFYLHNYIVCCPVQQATSSGEVPKEIRNFYRSVDEPRLCKLSQHR